RRRGPRGARRVHPACREARQARHGARGRTRRRAAPHVLRLARAVRHTTAHRRSAERRVPGAVRPTGELRQRAGDRGGARGGGALSLAAVMWPEPVERIASFLRESEAHGRLEELPADAQSPPGPAVRAESYDCDGHALVALLPDDAEVDRSRLARRAGCTEL